MDPFKRDVQETYQKRRMAEVAVIQSLLFWRRGGTWHSHHEIETL